MKHPLQLVLVLLTSFGFLTSAQALLELRLHYDVLSSSPDLKTGSSEEFVG